MVAKTAAKARRASSVRLFGNYSSVMLADEMGAIDAELHALKQRQDEARAEMTRRHLYSIEGACFVVTKAITSSWRFSADAAKKQMGVAWYEALKAEVRSTTYSVIPKPEETGGEGASCVAFAAARALFNQDAA